jgi:Cation efflux family
MACCANDHYSSDNRQPDGRYRRVLWVALVLNGGMFLTEIVAGLAAGSAALQADAVDFLSDAANYGISLSVVGLVLVCPTITNGQWSPFWTTTVLEGCNPLLSRGHAALLAQAQESAAPTGGG